MSRSLSADPSLLSVSLVAGPSAAVVCEKIAASHPNGGLINLHKGGSRDPAGIIAEITAVADSGAMNHLVVECDPEMPVMAYAALFQSNEQGPSPLSGVARLSATALAIKPATLLDALMDRHAETDRGSCCFVVEQIEFTGDIILDDTPDDSAFELARAIAITLNPSARVWPLSLIAGEKWLGMTDDRFDFTAALDSPGWRRLIDGGEPARSGQDNITAFAYRARRPFHPERFWHLLQHGLRGVFRAKGFFWLATRMDLVGGLNLAGAELHCASAGEWWAARDDHARQFEMPDRTRKEWREPFGDRRQAIAFMALDRDRDSLTAQLDSCLLSEAEMTGGNASWRHLADPFAPWTGHAPHDQCNHDHGSTTHDCCPGH